MSTHPPSDERVKQMKQMAKKEKSNSKARISSTEFTKIKAKIERIMKA
jgi:predicted Zn-dependent protease